MTQPSFRFWKSTIVLFLLAICAINPAHAQVGDPEGDLPDVYKGNKVTLILEVVNSAQKPQAYTDVWLYEAESNTTINNTTNRKGQATFYVGSGHKYVINFRDRENVETLDVPAKSQRLIIKKMVHNPKARGTEGEYANIDTVWQKLKDDHEPAPGHGVMIFKITKEDGSVQKKPVNIYLLNSGIKRMYAATSTTNGVAVFELPIGQSYPMSIGTVRKFKTITMPNVEGMQGTNTISFEQADVIETIKEDTVRQVASSIKGAATDRALVTILLKNYSNEPLVDEEIYLSDEQGTMVFVTKSNANGVAKALLPKGYNYVLGCKYERNIDILKVEESKYFHNIDIEMNYEGTQAIEQYLTNAKRNKEGFVIEFKNATIKTQTKPALSFTKKKTPYGESWEVTDKAIQSPLLIPERNRVLLTDGMYSDVIQCVNMSGTATDWAVNLMEGGPSGLTLEDGTLLVNTESCSIYAINAENGQLRWAYWLSPYLYTSPSVADGRVYVTYKTDLFNAFGHVKAKEHVLLCLDLKTGKIVWQNWMEEEGISAPVIENGKVYVTQWNGALSSYDAVSGKLLKTLNLNFSSQPTVCGDKIFISKKSGNEQSFVQLNSSDLQPGAGKIASSSRALIASCNGMNPCLTMQFQGLRPIATEKYLIINTISHTELIDRATMKSLWKVPTGQVNAEALSSVASPVWCGKYIVVTVSKQSIWILDSKTGAVVKKLVLEADAGLWTTPLVYGGKIWAAQSNGRFAVIDSGIPTLQGEVQWQGGGGHNAYYKN